MIVLTLALCLANSIVGLAVLVFFVQMLLSLPRTRPTGVRRVRVVKAVLVPAHDESGLIAHTVEMLRGQISAGDRLLVVADNCADDTALLASEAGAEVIVRRDFDRRGKGYALDAGIRHLAATGAPDVLVIMDADCVAGVGSVEMLAGLCARSGRPIQAAYTMMAHPTASPRMRIAAFAHEVKTVGRPLGWSRAGLPCHLMGTGMAIPWPLALGVDLANGSIVEDLELGIRLALAGAPPRFCDGATVSSFLPRLEDGHQAQKTRWEHGHLGTIGRYVPQLAWQALRRRDGRLAAMALDLAVPPLAALAFSCGLLAVAAALFAAVTGSLAPLYLSGAILAVFGLSVALAWWRWGNGIVRAADIVALPGFVLRKLPILIGFLTRRQIAWIRSERGVDVALVAGPQPAGMPIDASAASPGRVNANVSRST